MSNKFKLYDAFETKAQAKQSAKDLRAIGDKARVKRIPHAVRLKYGVFIFDERDIRKEKRIVSKFPK